MAPSSTPAYLYAMVPSPWQSEIRRALSALGGEATLGDLLAVTGLARSEVERALEELIAVEAAHVRVSGSGDVVYHGGRGPWPKPEGAPRDVRFERKTVQLIRAREGVLSVAELVEHTGLRAAAAEREMSRLVEWYGGVPHVSLDGHVVYAFPELMASAHGRFPGREPRPAWVRAEAPVPDRSWTGRILDSRREKVRRHVLGLVVQTALAGKGVVSLERAVGYLSAREGRRVRRSRVEAALRELAADFGAPVSRLDDDVFFGFRNVKRQFLASQVVRRQLRLARTATGETVFDTADSPARARERELEAFDRELKEPMTAMGWGTRLGGDASDLPRETIHGATPQPSGSPSPPRARQRLCLGR